jgi:hypothetical protein
MNTDDRIQETSPVAPATDIDLEVRELPSIATPRPRWYSPSNLAKLSVQVVIAIIVWFVLIKMIAMFWSWKQMADGWPRG